MIADGGITVAVNRVIFIHHVSMEVSFVRLLLIIWPRGLARFINLVFTVELPAGSVVRVAQTE